MCISSAQPASEVDRVHELLLQRLWSVAREASRSLSAKQYQCLGPQYQSGTCSEEPPAGAASDSGGKRASSHDQKRTAAHATTAVRLGTLLQVGSRGRARVLAAAVTRERRPVKAVVRESPRQNRRFTREVAAGRQTSASSSDEWLLRSLIALIGIAMLAFLLAALPELPRAGTAVTGVRSRLASKGLSASRIDLGDRGGTAPRRGGGISYRD